MPGNVLKIIGVITFLLIVVSSRYLFSSAQDNHSTLEITSRDAIQKSVNMGAVRVNEEVTINPEMAKEVFVRQFVESSNFDDGDRVLNIVGLNSNPAMLAVESYQILDYNPATRFMGSEKPSTVRDVDVIIYEAKSTTDNRGGDLK